MNNYDVSEIEDLVKEEEPEPERDNSSLFLSKVAYNLAVTVIDIGTGYLIWQLTFWYYGLIWFLAGAVVFFLHQKNFFTAGNNDKQIKGAQNGIIVSVASIIIMAMLAGGLYVFNVKNLWVEVGLILISLALFFYHAYMLAMYVFNDDGFRINNSISRAYAQADKKTQIAKASGKVAKVYREADLEKKAQYQKHGEKNIDAAMNKIQGKQPQQQFKPMTANAQDVDTVKLNGNKHESPHNGGER